MGRRGSGTQPGPTGLTPRQVYNTPPLSVGLITHGVTCPQVNGNFKRINHNSDPIPIVPGRSMGYSHVDGEIHISGSNAWNSCSGNDSTERGCTIDGVPNILLSNLIDHLGAYSGVFIGSPFCV